MGFLVPFVLDHVLKRSELSSLNEVKVKQLIGFFSPVHFGPRFDGIRITNRSLLPRTAGTRQPLDSTAFKGQPWRLVGLKFIALLQTSKDERNSYAVLIC